MSFDTAAHALDKSTADRPGLLPAKDRAARALMLAALAAAPPSPAVAQLRPALRPRIKAWSTAIGDAGAAVEVRLAALNAYTVDGHTTLTSTRSLPVNCSRTAGLWI